MTGVFANVDDKHVPLYRIVWVSEVPHFCGAEDCTVEGKYEIRLDAAESLFGTSEERDAVIRDMESWHRGSAGNDGEWG